MRIKPVDALPEVAGDLATAAAHYQSWRTDGQEHILQKYDETVSWIAWNPDQFPRCRFGCVRRAILCRATGPDIRPGAGRWTNPVALASDIRAHRVCSSKQRCPSSTPLTHKQEE